MKLVEGEKGGAGNAEALGKASELAYLGPDEGVKAFREQLSLDAVLHSVGNTQAWIAQNDDHVVVAFRGTEGPTSLDGIKDWFLTDALNLLILPEGRLGTDLAAAGVGARFHAGFVNAIADIWGPVLESTEKALEAKDRPLWVTGHSLGGALAQLAAWLFLRKTIGVHQVYTYGGPMIGNDEAAKAFDARFAGKVFRYVNQLDPVPCLPSMSLVSNTYLHCEKEMTEAAEEKETAKAYFGSWLGKAAEGVLTGRLIVEFWEGLKSRLAAHNLDAYFALLKKLSGSR